MENVDNIPNTYYCPQNNKGERVEVVKPGSRKGGKRNKSLMMNMGAVTKMSLDAAYREILSNLIDAVVEANQQSFVDLKIGNKIQDDEKITIFHNNNHILGEIIESLNYITFVNFGPNISTFEQIIQIGASNKEGIANQIGQHGEGLKRAALKLLIAGFTIEIFFAIKLGDDTEFRHLTFKINSKNCLTYSLYMINPCERKVGYKDQHRFEVIIWKNSSNNNQKDDKQANDKQKNDNINKLPAFDLDKFMIKDRSLIRGARSIHDSGSVIIDPVFRGNIYVWHFYVRNYSNVHFGYDIFLRDINRDRNEVNVDVLRKSVAAIWSHSIVEDRAMGKIFLDFVLKDNDDKKRTFEFGIFPLLLPPALHILRSIFEEGEKRRPVRQQNLEFLIPRYQKSRFMVLPDHAMDLLEITLEPINNYLSNIMVEFVSSPRDLIDSSKINSILKSVGKIRSINLPNSPVNYYYDDNNKTLLLNARDIIVNGQVLLEKEDKFWHQLIFIYLPAIFKDDEAFDGMKIIKLLGSVEKEVNRQMNKAVIVVDNKDANDNKDDENNEQEDSSPGVRKKARVDLNDNDDDNNYDEDEDNNYDENDNDSDYEGESYSESDSSDVAPPGYAFYQGPKLLVKLP